jgi:hypothetical protein
MSHTTETRVIALTARLQEHILQPSWIFPMTFEAKAAELVAKASPEQIEKLDRLWTRPPFHNVPFAPVGA